MTSPHQAGPRWRTCTSLLAVGLLGMALLALAPSTAAAETKFHGCGGPEADIEPAEVVLSCADAKLRVEELQWSLWEAEEARAAGLLTYPDCPPRVPLYRCRSYAHQPVILRLARPVNCQRYRARVFTLAVVIDEEAPTPATRMSPYLFRCPRVRKPRRPRFFLGKRYAARLMRTALGRDGRLSFAAAYNRQVKCEKRVSRIRVRCRMSWIVGDLYYEGHGLIWITKERGKLYWNFTYQVVRRNAYCEATGGGDCTKVIVRR